MKILIATGIFPPDIGGPAQYAKNLRDVWERQGHDVSVRAFSFERRLPTVIRHCWFLFRCIIPAFRSDLIFCPDTFSAAVPIALIARIMRKPLVIRTGGDFLWEMYIERTADLVLFRTFYETRKGKLSLKERIIFRLVSFSLKSASVVIFSTGWQRDIFIKAYRLDRKKTRIVENYFGPKVESFTPVRKDFVAGTRPLLWKNSARVAEAFTLVRARNADVVYDAATVPHERFLDKIAHSYAVIIASLGDISPNTILDAIRADKPFILTKETGLYEKLKDIALWVDPEDVSDIAEKVALLCDPVVYETYKGKVSRFMFTHTWEEIAEEIIQIYRSLP